MGLEGCSKGPCKGGTMRSTVPQIEILTKQGTYLAAVLETAFLKTLNL